MKKEIKQLKKLISETDNRLVKYVAESILDDAENGYEGNVKSRVKDIIQSGCVSGTVSELIYHSDCKKFYIEYMDEIHELVEEIEADMGEKIENRHNTLILTFYAWVAYEETARKIGQELGDYDL